MTDNSKVREPSLESRSSAPLTDSPWFWAALFTGMALVALVAMSGKYGRRQASIEQKYQARERVRWDAERQMLDGRRQKEENAAGSGQKAEGSVEYSRPGDTVIPLWPLAVPLAGVFICSIAMLVRGKNVYRGDAENAEKNLSHGSSRIEHG